MNEKVAATTLNGNSAAAADSSPQPQHDVTKKRTPDQYTRNFDLNEINPLRGAGEDDDGGGVTIIKNGVNNADHRSSIHIIETDDQHGTAMPPPPAPILTSRSTNKLKGTYYSILTNLHINEKARMPFMLTIGLAAILLLIIIVMIAFWPRIPYYMKANICVDKECMQASSQVFFFFVE